MQENNQKKRVRKVTLLRPNQAAVELNDGRIKLVDLVLIEEGIYAERESIVEKLTQCFEYGDTDLVVIAER